VVATVGVSDGEQGFVGGLVNMSRQVGAAFGVAVAAAIIGVGASSGTSLVADRNAVFAAAGAVLVASLVVLRMLTSGSRQGAKLVDLLRSPAERSGSDAAA